MEIKFISGTVKRLILLKIFWRLDVLKAYYVKDYRYDSTVRGTTVAYYKYNRFIWELKFDKHHGTEGCRKYIVKSTLAVYISDLKIKSEDSFRKLQRNQEFENCDYSNTIGIYILYSYSYLASQGYTIKRCGIVTVLLIHLLYIYKIYVTIFI